MFLSDRSHNVHLTAGGARSAQRTLAGEGICTLQRNVEIVNRLESETLTPADPPVSALMRLRSESSGTTPLS
jgi:hypothetical protein